MSNRRQHELSKHKKSDKVKWIFTGVSFVLVFATLAGMCLQLFGKDKWKPSEWFKKPDTEQTTPVPEEGNEASGLISSTVIEGNGISLMRAEIPVSAYSEYGVSPLAESAVTLTATITPANATDTLVDWSVKYVSGSGTPTEVKVTPTTDGALTAVAECVAAFDKQIEIVVTSRDNPDATASCVCDYAKRLSLVRLSNGVEFKPNGTSSVSVGTWSNAEIAMTISNAAKQYGIGTVNDSFTFSYNITYSTSWINALKNVGHFTIDKTAGTKYQMSALGGAECFGSRGVGTGALSSSDYQAVKLESNYKGQNYVNYQNAARSMNGGTFYTLEIVATGKYSAWTVSVEVKAEATAFYVGVSSVNVNTAEHVF